MRTQKIFVLKAALLLCAVSLYAHHPFSSEYDWMKPVTLTGTVDKLEWMNPHSILYVDAPDSTGQMKHWTLELGSSGALTRAGWTMQTVKHGDQITMDAWLAKDGKDRANVKSVRLADGRELSGASSILNMKPEKPVRQTSRNTNAVGQK